MGTCPFFVRISFGADDGVTGAVSRGDGAFPRFFSVSKGAKARIRLQHHRLFHRGGAALQHELDQAPPTPASAPAGARSPRTARRDAIGALQLRARADTARAANSSPRARRPRSFARRSGVALPPSAQRYSTTNAAAADGTRDRIARLSQTRDVEPTGGRRGRGGGFRLCARAAASTAANDASASLAADASPSGPSPRAAGRPARHPSRGGARPDASAPSRVSRTRASRRRRRNVRSFRMPGVPFGSSTPKEARRGAACRAPARRVGRRCACTRAREEAEARARRSPRRRSRARPSASGWRAACSRRSWTESWTRRARGSRQWRPARRR